MRLSTVECECCRLVETLAQIFTLETPFSHIGNDHAVSMRVMKGERPSKPTSCQHTGFTDTLWDLMQRGWTSNPESRPLLSAFIDILEADC
jgi:hypothetical protein